MVSLKIKYKNSLVIARAILLGFMNLLPAAQAENGHDYYYTTLAGDTVYKISRAIYGDSKKKNKIYDMNPSLKGKIKVEAGVKVYFNFSEFNSPSEMLTKELISRYKKELLLKIEQRQGEKILSKVIVEKGDTLQKIALRVLGTVRLWTELYIVNQKTISHYDHVFPGMELVYYPPTNTRVIPPVAGIMGPAPAPEKKTEVSREIAAEKEKIAKEIKKSPSPPVPVQLATALPTEVKRVTKPPPVISKVSKAGVKKENAFRGEWNKTKETVTSAFSNENRNQVLYVVGVIALILLVGYGLTRPAKKKLVVTTSLRPFPPKYEKEDLKRDKAA